jgi:hypothetical protein
MWVLLDMLQRTNTEGLLSILSVWLCTPRGVLIVNVQDPY